MRRRVVLYCEFISLESSCLDFAEKPHPSYKLSSSTKVNITMTFKAIQEELPGYMSEMFEFNHNDMYQLRRNDCKLYLGKPSTDFMKKSFSYRGASAWNDLPNNDVNGYNELSIRSFKTLINNHFIALGRS